MKLEEYWKPILNTLLRQYPDEFSDITPDKLIKAHEFGPSFTIDFIATDGKKYRYYHSESLVPTDDIEDEIIPVMFFENRASKNGMRLWSEELHTEISYHYTLKKYMITKYHDGYADEEFFDNFIEVMKQYDGKYCTNLSSFLRLAQKVRGD